MRRAYRLLIAILCLTALAGCGGGEEERTVTGTVTVSVSCRTAAENRDKLKPEAQSEDVVPADGVIVSETQVDIAEGDTAYSVLVAVTKHRIQVETVTTPGVGSVYVKSINNLYEFDGGPRSGWTYRVNGEFLRQASNKTVLKDGDTVEWLYTCDDGKDLAS